MKETKYLTCIGCPVGCALAVELEDGEITKVIGNRCPVGNTYARKEISNPTRIITTVLPVIGGTELMVSCKTSKDIPKKMIPDCIEQLKGYHVEAPIKIGDILFKGICGTDIDIIATKNVKKA